jgi:hypothetical protein
MSTSEFERLVNLRAWSRAHEHTDAPYPGELLCARRERPRCRRAAERG